MESKSKGINGNDEHTVSGIFMPRAFVKNLSYDEFCDWCETGTSNEIEDLIIHFVDSHLYEHVDVMKIIANRKRKEEQENE